MSDVLQVERRQVLLRCCTFRHNVIAAAPLPGTPAKARAHRCEVLFLQEEARPDRGAAPRRGKRDVAGLEQVERLRPGICRLVHPNQVLVCDQVVQGRKIRVPFGLHVL